MEEEKNENKRDICYYFSHINWKWVLELSIERFITEITSSSSPSSSNSNSLSNSNSNISINNLTQIKFLPSLNYFKEISKKYSLFRIEIILKNHIYCLWVTSSSLEFLDPKDSLYKSFKEVNSEISMPKTKLLSWNISSINDINDLPSYPSLLKAPLGSGGDCLYYVNSSEDILTICKNHQKRAESVPNFIDNLIEQYGEMPKWSLQELFPTLVLSNNKKCQIRAYIISINSKLFLYNDYEVRQPFWEDDESIETTLLLSSSSSSQLEVDLEVCQNTTARPYNSKRSKQNTERLMLNEINELPFEQIHENITNLLKNSFQLLKDQIIHQNFSNNSNSNKILFPNNEHLNFSNILTLSEMAIAGIDILIDSSYQPKIVELNNNPAMPGKTKKMTNNYYNHLIELVKNIIGLGFHENLNSDSNNLDSNFREELEKYMIKFERIY